MSDQALHDSYAGVRVDLPEHGIVHVPALRFGDAMRLLALADRVQKGELRAALQIVRQIAVVVGIDSKRLDADSAFALFSRLFDPRQYMPPAPTEQPKTEEPKGIEYTWTDLIAEYAATYGGPPRFEDPWPLVLALIQRTPRFENRQRLRLLDSVTEAIGAVLAPDPNGALHRDDLWRGAYPTTRIGPPMVIEHQPQEAG